MCDTNPYAFATVAEVAADGLVLRFPGEDQPGAKHYRCNTTAQFEAGQRVCLLRDSGSYVVLFPVGAPGSGYAAKTKTCDTAKSCETAQTCQTAKTCTTATGVDNTGKSYADIEFRAPYTNQLEYRIKGQQQWNVVANNGTSKAAMMEEI